MKRVKNLVEIENDKDYKLVTVKMYHKGVTLRNITKGSDISSKKMHSVKSGEFILSGIDARHGAFGIVPAELEGAVVTNDFWCLEFDENVIDKHLFLKLTSTSFFDDLCKKASDGTTNRVRLQAEKFYNLEIDLPSVDEQKVIIEEFQKLETSNNQITTELSHQLELVRQLRQAFLREAMQGKLVPQETADEPAEILLGKIKAEKEKLIAEKKIKKDKPVSEIKVEEIPFEIPNNWAFCRLGGISNNVEYGTSEKADLNSSNIAVLRMNNIQSGKVLLENLKYVKATIEDLPRLYLKNDDLLFNRTNSYELVGKAGIFKGESDKLTFASYLIRVQFSEFVSVDFANYYINSIQCRETQIEPDIIQQNGQANFNGTKLKNIIVPLPPLAEQKRIVEKLEKLMKYCDELEANIRESKERAESLLQVALKEALEPK